MSIRVTSSGHNFSIDNNSPSTEPVVALIESFKAMLVPTPLLEEESVDSHLLAAGITFDADREEVIVVKRDEVTSALIVIPSDLRRGLSTLYGDNVSFSTPLLSVAPGHGHEVLIHLSEDKTLLCISLFNGGDLIFAELFELRGVTDILYWLTRLGEVYDLKNYTIFIDGADMEATKLLKNYYKSVVICE